MKLDYLSEGSPDCPLIRLYDFKSAEIQRFHTALLDLAGGSPLAIEVHRLPFVESINDCRLTLYVTSWDGAVILKAKPAIFDCGFTAATWENIAALVKPFTQDGSGFQWLARAPGEASWLISASEKGEW
jgi:hypothetical protein